MNLDTYDRAMERLAERHAPFKVSLAEGESGDWRVSRFTVAPGIAAMRCAFGGRPVPPGEYTRLIQVGGAGLFMSDTPAELDDARGLLYAAQGHVLITGLGLGMIPNALLLRGKVCQITIVEREADVIRLVAPAFADKPVEIIQADAFEWRPEPETIFDWAWHDIWPDMCSDHLPEFARLRRRYARFMAAPGRQLVWGEDQIRREMRRWS